MKYKIELEAILDSHCLSVNVILKLYVAFVKVNGAGSSLTNVSGHVGLLLCYKAPITMS